MTLQGIFSYQQSNNTEDINALNKKIIDRGIFDDGEITLSSTSLQVFINPFRAVGYDGMIVISDEITTLTIPTNQTSYIICYAKWINGSNPTIELKVITELEWITSPNRLYFITFLKLTVPSGVTYIDEAYITYSDSDYADKIGKSSWKNSVNTYASLPTTYNKDGDIRVAGNITYQWNNTTKIWGSLFTGDTSTILLNNWIKRPVGANANLTGAAFQDDIVVVVGQDYGGDAEIYVSKDRGVTWTAKVSGVQRLSKIITITINSINYFVAIGSDYGDGVVLTSTDGNSWSLAHTFPGSTLNKMKIYNNELYIVGDSGGIFHTDDLSTWNDYSITNIGFDCKDIAYDGTINWVVVGDNGYIVQNNDITNTNGWVLRESSGTSTVWAIDYGQGKFVAGMAQTIYVSEDALTWTPYNGIIKSGYSPTELNFISEHGIFVLFCGKYLNTVTYYNSTDGENWEDVTGSINATTYIGNIAIDDRGVIITCSGTDAFFSYRV